MAVTGSAIFGAVVTGQTRLKYYELVYYRGVISQDDRKKEGSYATVETVLISMCQRATCALR
jgi:hypothetical protein